MIHEIGKGTPMGRILCGKATTARCFGIERAPVVRGPCPPMIPCGQGRGVTYATTTMERTTRRAMPWRPTSWDAAARPILFPQRGRAEISRNLQIATAAIDATGYCLFTAFALLDQPETMQALVDTINAMYDLNMTLDDVTELGKDILRKERAFNAAAGFTKAHDRLPLYFSRESVAPHNVRWDVSDEDLDSVFNF
ncbi:MAG: aldehyde ferredoxin oxidoreductase C-terminal domain-containing protein [Bilophila wadsworthia]